MNTLTDKLKLLPDNPGVYVMLDKFGTVIYVGKAKNLKNRVRQYFHSSVKTEKVMAMVSNIADFYYIITPSEIDALSLENNLIKKYKPRYNILLKDDKTYPYIKIDLKENFPTLKITRRLKKDGAKYFGPFMGGINVGEVIETVNLLYGIRPCDKVLSSQKTLKPCLNYHICKCSAPCGGLITRDEYAKRVDLAIDFLSGDISGAEKTLTEKMNESAEKEQFELALKYKEALLSLDKVKIKRLTSLNKYMSCDVIAYASNGIYSVINVLIVRNGRMLGAKNYPFESASLSDSDALSEFISRYYDKNNDLPEEIVIGTELKDEEVVKEFLKTKFQKAPEILSVKMGIRRQLVDMAEANATEHLEIAVDRIKHKEDMTVSACAKLKETLNLKNFPHRMECYDISNVSGVDKVGSMVVFTDGEKDATEYRRFKIKTFEGADDYRAHQEMMERRLDKLIQGDPHFSKPDLIIIDGGKGQLSAVKEVFDKKGIDDIDLIALAEKNEEVYTLYSGNPVVMKKSDYVLRMLIRIRDEAHRFAVTYHRTLREKRMLDSVLDGIEGLGKVKKQALLERFKDVSKIALASKEELKQVRGIGDRQAELIINKLREGTK